MTQPSENTALKPSDRSLRAANEIFHNSLRTPYQDGAWGGDEESDIRDIAFLIDAERERCAKHLEATASTLSMSGNPVDWAISDELLKQAQQIRERGRS